MVKYFYRGQTIYAMVFSGLLIAAASVFLWTTRTTRYCWQEKLITKMFMKRLMTFCLRSRCFPDLAYAQYEVKG